MNCVPTRPRICAWTSRQDRPHRRHPEAANDIFDTPVGRVYGVEIIADSIHTLLKGAALRPFDAVVLGLLFLLAILATAGSRRPASPSLPGVFTRWPFSSTSLSALWP